MMLKKKKKKLGEKIKKTKKKIIFMKISKILIKDLI